MLLALHLIEMHMERGQRKREGRKEAASKDREKPWWDYRRYRCPYFDVWA